MRLVHFLDDLAAEAMRVAIGADGDTPALLRPTQDAQHGDFQVNGVLPLAKRRGVSPRELAEPVAVHLAAHPAITAAAVAGPGFINLRLAPAWLSAELNRTLEDSQRDGVPLTAEPENIVVDFSAPNIAKQMHVGHLRSTILGDAIVRLLRFVGHQVTGDNHLGDWGTQYGLLILGTQRWGSPEAMRENPVAELERVYQLATAASRDDSTIAEEARVELAKLHAGDPENRRRWRQFVDDSLQGLQQIYDRLGVSFDTWRGESAYHDMLPDVVQRLLDAGVARLDAGAVCVFFDQFAEAPKELRQLKTPLIVRKQDGAYLYATTDIATGLYRNDVLKATRAICVVDVRQSLHFQQVFTVLSRLGVSMRMEHVGFGTILGTDGKPLRTRDGGTVPLASLLDEAEQRAAQRIAEQGLDVPAAQQAVVARAVGLGAVKYADLRQNRLSDYRFDWDKMLSFQGNAGPYLQYAYARIASLLRKAQVAVGSLDVDPHTDLRDPEEIVLAKRLMLFADAVHEAAQSAQPHLLCDYLYALARDFSSFYEACPVLKAEDPALQRSRLGMARLTARQLQRGLALLGIDTVEQM